ncbi:hypothetical protein MMC26_003923 [Xylographa opegraphella]|nr:hypothetical protein [Xylographa opegraphella]
MCRIHSIFIVCRTCNIRSRPQPEFWCCPYAVFDKHDTLRCERRIEQTSTVIRDRQCLKCDREQEEAEQISNGKQRAASELVQWEQELLDNFGPFTLEDGEVEACTSRLERWGRFSDVGESPENFDVDNISLNF